MTIYAVPSMHEVQVRHRDEQRHDVLLTRLTPCTLLTMHYGGRLEALGPSFILSPLKLGGPTRLRPSLFLALSLSFTLFYSFSPLSSFSCTSFSYLFSPFLSFLSYSLFSLFLLSLSLSACLPCRRRIIPHIIEHRAQERKIREALSLSTVCSSGAYSTPPPLHGYPGLRFSG